MKYSHLGDHHAMIPIKDRQTKSQRFEYGRTSYFKGIRSWYQTGIQTWTHSDSHNTKTLAQEDFFHPWAIQIRSSFYSKVFVFSLLLQYLAIILRLEMAQLGFIFISQQSVHHATSVTVSYLTPYTREDKTLTNGPWGCWDRTRATWIASEHFFHSSMSSWALLFCYLILYF